MEFIKVGKNYMIKNSNGRIISEEEKLKLENEELIIKDFKSNECQAKTTQKIIKNKKRIKKLEKQNIEFNDSITNGPELTIKTMDDINDIIEETD